MDRQQSWGEEGNFQMADEVLHVSSILGQEGAAQEGGQYVFQVDPDSAPDGDRFELSRDDTLCLIGLLNSSDVDMARRELGSLLNHLERPAVQGLVLRLFVALKRRSSEP